MQRIPVDSSDLQSVGYDLTSMTLEIEFRRGRRVYRYTGVPPVTFKGLMRAPSKSRFFAELIRDVYPCQKPRRR